MNLSSTSDIFVAQHGQQTGPFSLDKVQRMLAAGEITPDSLCWAEGMSDWQPLQDVLPVYTPPVRVPAAFSSAALGGAPAEINPYAPPQASLLTDDGSFQPSRSYGGIGRVVYFVLIFGWAVFQNLVVFSLKDEDSAVVMTFFGVIVSLFIVSLRLQNIGVSRWWCLLGIVPIANIVIGLRCILCQEGYNEIRRLDNAGRLLAWIIGVLFFGTIALLLLSAFAGF